MCWTPTCCGWRSGLNASSAIGPRRILSPPSYIAVIQPRRNLRPISAERLMSDSGFPESNAMPESAPQSDLHATLPGPGAQLAAQRQALDWSVEQIADQLKLAPRQVLALENDNYSALPGAAVTRGFVRAYAKVLKMDADALLAMLPSGVGSDPIPLRRELSTPFAQSRMPFSGRR